MQIYIDNKLAALKKGTSFEYVSENRLFSGSDGYSLTITFPLRDCPQNQAIFGHINRADVSAGKVVFDCEIRARDFHRYGCVTITEINEAEVKTQFLDGRSEQNFKLTLDDVYINELDLGEPATTSKSEVTPSEAWSGADAGSDSVALPWVLDSSDSGNLQNCAVWDSDAGEFKWHESTSGLSWQPYLIDIAMRICSQIGYGYDFADWAVRPEYRYLLVCNALPFAWFTPQFARALPHWSVPDFFQKLELFLGAEFEFDHRGKKVTCRFTRDVLASTPPVRIDSVIEQRSTEVKAEDASCEYVEARNLAYKSCEHSMWKYYSCDWFIKSRKEEAVSFPSLYLLLTVTRSCASWVSSCHNAYFNKLLYAKNVDTYFIVRTVSRTFDSYAADGKTIRWRYKCVLQPLNLLGPRIVDDSDEAQTEEIEFVPACVDYTDDDYGFALFLQLSGYDEEDSSVNVQSSAQPFSDEWYAERNARFTQTQPTQALIAGEEGEKAEYYDRVYVAWWDGNLNAGEKPPYPQVSEITVNPDWSGYSTSTFSMRLAGSLTNRDFRAPEIDPSSKTTFKFIADSIPDVRALFFIKGKRYVCEKLTATFTEQGMSQLIKGVFYPVKD